MPKSRFLRALLAIIFLLVAYVLVWAGINFVRARPGPGQPTIARAAEITGIDRPLDPNGDIDFLQLINAKLVPGVSTDNNAAIPIIQTLDPSVFHRLPDKYFAYLGIARPDGKDGILQQPSSWAYDNDPDQMRGLPSAQEDRLESNPGSIELMQRFAQSHIWTDHDLPELGKWLVAMKQPMQTIEEGLQRPCFYLPIVADRSQGPKYVLPSIGTTVHLRPVVEAFRIRANHCLANNDFQGWFDSTKAIYRLAKHVADGIFLVDQLSAISMFNQGDELVANAIVNGALNADQLAAVLDELKQLPFVDGMSGAIKLGERFLALERVNSMARYGAASLSKDPAKVPMDRSMMLRSADWNIVLEVVDRDFKELAELTEKDPQEWIDAFESFEVEMDRRQDHHQMSYIGALLGGRGAKGRYLGEEYSSMFLPSVRHISQSFLRHRAQREMCKLSAALQLFELKNGSHPEELKELVPEFFDRIPMDPLSGLPFRYVLQDELFLLYSVGANRIDEHGDSGPQKHSYSDYKLPYASFLSWNEFVEQQQQSQ